MIPAMTVTSVQQSADLGFVSGPIGTLATDAGAPQRKFAPDVLHISLLGEVGPEKPISLAAIQRRLAVATFRHLHVTVTSPGGDSDEGLRIYEFLRALPQPVSVIAVGHCYSAALDILAAGSYRIATADCVLLLHQTSRARDSLPARITAEILNRAATDLARTDARVVDLLHARTGFSRDFFAAEIMTEEPLSVSGALDCGLLHEVEGMTQRVDPNWPDVVGTFPPQVYIAPRLRTSNYAAACRTAASLYEWPGA